MARSRQAYLLRAAKGLVGSLIEVAWHSAGARGASTSGVLSPKMDIYKRFMSSKNTSSSTSSGAPHGRSGRWTISRSHPASGWRGSSPLSGGLEPTGGSNVKLHALGARYVAGSQVQQSAVPMPAVDEIMAITDSSPPPACPPPTPVTPASTAAAIGSQGETIRVEGTVQKVLYRDPTSGYTVLRVAASAVKEGALGKEGEDTPQPSSPSKGAGKRAKTQMVTVVGSIPHVVSGQSVRITGSWTDHKQYGRQLKANDIEELKPTTNSDLLAYLSGGVIPGVGPVIAKRLVDAFGNSVEDVLNSSDAIGQLATCDGIGGRTAQRIKEGWDAGLVAREGSRFLREAGLSAALAQRVAQRYGPATKEVVIKDPYAALAPFKRHLPLSKIDAVAAHVGASPDLVSRAAAAISHVLEASSAQEGHSYLPWHILEGKTRKFLSELARQHANEWSHPAELHLVIQHMHSTGAAVLEPNTAINLDQLIAAAASGGVSSSNTSSSSGDNHPEFLDDGALRAYVAQRAPAASKTHLDAMLNTLGKDLLSALDLHMEDAVAALSTCPRIGIKTAQKIKQSWDGTRSPAFDASSGGTIGLTMSALLENPPTLTFDWGPDVRCYSCQMHAAEATVAARIAAKAALFKPPSKSRLTRIRKWIDANQEGRTVELSAGQIAAIEAASDAPVLVVTGGPGCGKTTAVQTVVKLWCAQGKLVKICAPTGRAAQRLGIIQGIEPSTIHRMLKYAPRGSGSERGGDSSDEAPDDGHLDGWGSFEYNNSTTLPAHAVLVDEASMLSLPLAAALVDALQSKTQLVLVGDVDQLPSVGPGSVLQSLISSGMVPVVDLREVFRQAAESAIVTSALAVRRGQPPDLPLASPTHSDLITNVAQDAVVVRCPSPESLPGVVHQVVGVLQGMPGAVDSDLQVISPMRKGAAGTSALNPALQALLNPPGPGKTEITRPGHGSHGDGSTPRVFRVGDRVLQMVNNYDKDVFNGDQGRIVAAWPSEKSLHVEFPHLRDPASNGIESESQCIREYRGNELSELELSYAVTVHKAQGGESKHVVLALSTHHGRMLTRRLLYTALTRAKERLVLVATGYPGGEGDAEDPLGRAVRRQEGDIRTSWLTERLALEAGALGVLPKEPAVFSNEAEVLQRLLNDSQHHEEHSNEALPTGDAMYVQQNLEQLPGLCCELGIDDASLVENMTQLSLIGESPLVEAEAVMASVEKLKVAFNSSSRSASELLGLPQVLTAVPRLLVSSPEYVERGLAFALKLGPLQVSEMKHASGESQGVENESLVDQLRRLMGHVMEKS